VEADQWENYSWSRIIFRKTKKGAELKHTVWTIPLMFKSGMNWKQNLRKQLAVAVWLDPEKDNPY